MLCMLSPDVRSTTPGYCTLLQVVTKRRGDDYIPVNILFIAHISAILCDNCIVPGLKCSLLYIARSAAFDGELNNYRVRACPDYTDWLSFVAQCALTAYFRALRGNEI